MKKNYKQNLFFLVNLKGVNRLQKLTIVLVFLSLFQLGKSQTANSFEFPLDPTGWYLAQDFGVWNSTWGGYHLGEDYVVNNGDELPVYAPANGTVKHNANRTGYGRVVIIEHQLPDGNYVCSVHGHMRSANIAYVGQQVSKGTLIGYLSDDYNENGGYNFTHLHFGIKSGNYSSSWIYYGYGSSTTGWYDPSEFIEANSNSTEYSANFHAQADWPTVSPGVTYTWWVEFENSGTETWYNVWSDRVRLGTGTYSNPDQVFDIEHSSWEASTRPTTLDQTSVSPGSIGRFTFTFQVPSDASPGWSQEYHFTPLVETLYWMKQDDGQEITCFMRFFVEDGGGGEPDIEITDLWTEPANPEIGQEVDLYVVFTNVGDVVAEAIDLSYYIDGDFVDDDYHGTLLPGDSQEERETNYIFTSQGSYN